MPDQILRIYMEYHQIERINFYSFYSKAQKNVAEQILWLLYIRFGQMDIIHFYTIHEIYIQEEIRFIQFIFHYS